MSRYEKKFYSTSGEEFRADVYSVLVAFGVECPARQHAIKKLLMPGQRGSKGEIQDLDEALASVSRAVDMAYARLPEGGTLTGEAEPEPEPEPKSNLLTAGWGGPCWEGPHKQPVERVQQLPKPEPKPKPKPELVTWRLCVRIQPWEVDGDTLYAEWYPSGSIPEHWYPIEAHTQPIETVQQLPEGQQP